MTSRIRTSVVILSAVLFAALAGAGYLFSSASATTNVISAGTGQGTIVLHAHRIPSSDWASCFALTCDVGTGPGASMYFLVYNGSGAIVAMGFADETGTSVTGLNVGATYDVYPADCDLCHASTHDVVFDHWASGIAVRPLSVIAQSAPLSLDAYYKVQHQPIHRALPLRNKFRRQVKLSRLEPLKLQYRVQSLLKHPARIK